MQSIDVETHDKDYMYVIPAEPKINGQTGEPATDYTTGEVLAVVSLLQTSPGKAEVLKIAVANSGVPDGLTVGTYVRPVGLVATPWARVNNNGQLAEGIAYRATAIERSNAPATPAPSAPADSAVKSANPNPNQNQKTENTK
ncbi:hypothetical protein ACWGCW_19785 [Streptomyces sp. NPDC054933]